MQLNTASHPDHHDLMLLSADRVKFVKQTSRVPQCSTLWVCGAQKRSNNYHQAIANFRGPLHAHPHVRTRGRSIGEGKTIRSPMSDNVMLFVGRMLGTTPPPPTKKPCWTTLGL